jgi:RNA polymerase sigma-70 factor (ECF subfamily)
VDELTRLALAAGQGDRAALAAFVRRTQGEVWRLCSHLGDRDQADDLTQEVYLRALPALGRFRGDAPARTWLLTVARRTCADAVRQRRRRRALLGRLASEAVTGPQAAPPATGDRVDLHQWVRALPADRREAFVLTQVLGLSYDEAASVCGCPIGTIRSRVARARGDLIDMSRDGGASELSSSG